MHSDNFETLFAMRFSQNYSDTRVYNYLRLLRNPQEFHPSFFFEDLELGLGTLADTDQRQHSTGLAFSDLHFLHPKPHKFQRELQKVYDSN